MNHFFTFRINNQGTQSWYQQEHDGPITICNSFPREQQEKIVTIPPEDMVMISNWYQYIKNHDIQNDFINPAGKNKEESFL